MSIPVVARAAVPTDSHAAAPPRRVLIADDSRVQRKILHSSLSRWGYEVVEAASGTEALELLRRAPFDFVLSDWMMPGLTGLELCRMFRTLSQDSYGYFILLTAKDEKSEVAHGLEVGADDFLAKPVNAAELHARMVAGERILNMERELKEKNRLVSATLAEIQALYAAVDRDLIEARKLQMTLARERERDFDTAHIAVLLRPSGHVGGDLVGYFSLDSNHLAFYAIDVSGHGIASAMLAARLAGMFTAATPEGTVAWQSTSWQGAQPLPPEKVAAQLNDVILRTTQADQYLTCVYAVAELGTGRVRLVQAGHPHPMVLRADGAVERIGAGGLPVGLVPGAGYERIELQLNPGDRLVLVSDGFTEAADPDKVELGDDGMAAFIAKNRELRGPTFLEALLWDVQGYVQNGDLGDDISAVVYEYRGR